MNTKIKISNAYAHNLKNISLEIPHHQLIVVTGVSGSGKSSLAFDIIAKEGQRRYLETLPSFSRQYAGKLNQAEVDEITGLSPVITVGQKTTSSSSKSTVGTLSDIYEHIRLLFARFGSSNHDIKLSKSLFSFNSDLGKCPTCNGIGEVEKIDIDKLIADPNLSIREGCLAPTLPTGYIMYSQLRMEIMNQLCEAEGFNVDIPWKDLNEDQKNVILYGSNKIKVEFGKHSLESRLKWTGIKAKPPEMDYYKGMIPTMSDILKRDRNVNILRYVTAENCPNCNGARLNQEALSVKLHHYTIHDFNQMELSTLKSTISDLEWNDIEQNIIDEILLKIDLIEDLGLGYLPLNRLANTLSASELQRIRIANQLTSNLSNVLYVFDEPSIGLDIEENRKLIQHLKRLVSIGNTVIVVEHDIETIRSADWIVDVGPKAGEQGGEIVFNGSLDNFLNQKESNGPTFKALDQKLNLKSDYPVLDQSIQIKNCSTNNLKYFDIEFKLGGLNIVNGPSGSGRKSLVKEILIKALEGEKTNTETIKGLEQIDQYIFIDQSPIGKTPRSNPATYLGISEHIRDLYAKLSSSKEKGLKKSHFSFNTKGGRCETCQGAGKIQIGMHFLGTVDIVCSSCEGKRFNPLPLEVDYKGLNISEVYQLTVKQAIEFFEGEKKILNGLQALQNIGLDYISLGQSSTTLSGGEAQRIKLANQLQKNTKNHCLYLFDEPSIGLHHHDLQKLIRCFKDINDKGHSIICIEQDEYILSQADWQIELGPKSGQQGGELVHMGKPKIKSFSPMQSTSVDQEAIEWIKLKGVRTHQLKNINVQFPKGQISAVTGLSGSGKSSLVYDTLFAEAHYQFNQSFSIHYRNLFQSNNTALLDHCKGLTPTIGIQRSSRSQSKRSTVGTVSGIHDHLRLLYSRLDQIDGIQHTAQHYSFNHELGACPACKGLSVIETCDPNYIIEDSNKSIYEGAFIQNKALDYYTDLNGQFIATLETLAHQENWDLNLSWNALSDEIKQIILYGTGEKTYEVEWHFKTKAKSGIQHLNAPWKGFYNYVDEEYQKTLHNKKTEHVKALMHDVTCPSCHGSRLKDSLLKQEFLNQTIASLGELELYELKQILSQYKSIEVNETFVIAEKIIPKIISSIEWIEALGLSYLSLNRSTNSLSGGEYQRLRIAGQLNHNLQGVTYVLDEPSIGLDSKQVQALYQIFEHIKSKGNTLIIIDHDKSLISKADYLVEIGPETGENGGEVQYQGTITKLPKDSLTYQLIHEANQVEQLNSLDDGATLEIKDAHIHHLKHFDVQFKTNELTVIKGISGSGKSSLVRDVLYQSYVQKRNIGCSDITGLEQFDQIHYLTQEKALAKNKDSLATYLGLLDLIGSIFSKTAEAKSLSLKKAYFNYNSKQGKCSHCNGLGYIQHELDSLSNLKEDCEDCNGLRYNDDVLAYKWEGKNIGQILQFSIHQASEFFKDKKVQNSLDILIHLGLGHLRLGQTLQNISSGEHQRLQMAKIFLNGESQKHLFLLDEPSTGLHQRDIKSLLKVFQNLLDKGHTIICIEYHDSIISSANTIFEMGPKSGKEGGEIISN